MPEPLFILQSGGRVRVFELGPDNHTMQHPPEPLVTEVVWYRNWECGFEGDACLWTGFGWRAYKGGCDLDAVHVDSKTWTGLLDAIDGEEG